MERYFFLIIIFLLTSCGISKFKTAVNGQEYHQEIITKEQAKLIFIESKGLPNNTQLSIGIIENGVQKFYGIKRERDTIFTFDNRESLFEIGSISKVFTATLLADFVINQQLELNNRISDYLERSIMEKSEITFMELANHTSGLPRLPSNINLKSIDLQNPYKNYNESKLIEYLKEELPQNPSKKFEYSNLGAGLLGYTLSKLASTSYEELLQTKIFSKYQMTNSTTIRNTVGNKLIKGLNEDGNETPNWDLNVLVGAGGILSSVSDLSKFASAQFDDSNEVLQLTRKSTFVFDYKSEIGLGWFLKTKFNEEVIGHDGGTGGYTSALEIDLRNRNGVVILSNVSAGNSNSANIRNLSNQLLETLKNE